MENEIIHNVNNTSFELILNCIGYIWKEETFLVKDATGADVNALFVAFPLRFTSDADAFTPNK